MGSFLFENEQTVDASPWVEPTVAEHEAALVDLSQHKSTSVAGARLRSFDRAERLYQTARALERPLLVEIAEGRVASVAAGVAWIEANAPTWFPTAKMVAIMIARACGTPALLRAAAIREVGE